MEIRNARKKPAGGRECEILMDSDIMMIMKYEISVGIII